MSVGYTKEDKEVQLITSAGVAVITTNNSDSQGTKRTSSHSAVMELSKQSPSPLLVDRSDEEDSDHGDPYTQNMKGRVSPSPYTANTERARQFNAYVRNLIEEKLDTLIPISHQPRELVQQIIADSNQKFPEFSSSVRKRIRTYLKSYRRSRRVKDMQAAAALATTYQANGLSSNKDQQVNNEEPINVSALALPSTISQSPAHTSAIVTISNPRNTVDNEGPDSKKRRLATQTTPPSSQPPVIPGAVHGGSIATATGQGLSSSEVASLKQLIQGYRESAAFLNRAADQLEELLAKDNPLNV